MLQTCLAKLFYFSASKVKYIGDLGNERPFPDFPCRAPPLVIDQEKITQGFVNEVEADVSGNFSSRTIVLNQGVQKCTGGEGIAEARIDQLGGEVSRGQRDVVVAPGEVSSELVTRLQQEP